MRHEPVREQVVGFDDLVEEVCWELIAGETVGRIGFTLDGLPWILPVNYRLLGRTLVFRTAIGSMLDALDPVAPVVLEVDRLDESTATGWSVIVRGTVQDVHPHVQPAVDGTVHPWAPGERDRWIWILPDSITGRAISRPAHADPPEL